MFTLVDGCREAGEIAALLGAYTRELLRERPDFAGYLRAQSYEKELLHPEAKYGGAGSRLYLAKTETGESAGCIGLLGLDESRCEMKRLYVATAHRGSGLGRLLCRQIMEDARALGYRQMLLGTFPFLKGAIALYRSLGFYEVESYNDTPLGGMLYLRLDL